MSIAPRRIFKRSCAVWFDGPPFLLSSSIEDTVPLKRMTQKSLSSGLQLAELGDRIRDERTRRSLSLEELARKARVSRSMLSAVERGAKAPSVLILDQVAAGLGTSIERLLGSETEGRC